MTKAVTKASVTKAAVTKAAVTKAAVTKAVAPDKKAETKDAAATEAAAKTETERAAAVKAAREAAAREAVAREAVAPPSNQLNLLVIGHVDAGKSTLGRVGENHLFCLFLNVAPPLLPYVQNLIMWTQERAPSSDSS